MGKKTKLREAQRREAEHAIAARLREHSGAKKRPGFIEIFSDFSGAYRARIERHRDLALRAPEQWRSMLRVRSPEQRFLELVAFAFAAYPVARHLENAWLADAADPNGRIIVPAGDIDAEAFGPADFHRWYIAAAQGRSLFAAATRHYMTRLETHHFVNAPDEIGETVRAFWYAFARAQIGDAAVALRISRTKLAGFAVDSQYWQDAARFFARNPTGVLEMNDVIDFLGAARQANNGFSLAGRTLASLRELMAAWHRALRRSADGLCWPGAPLPDARYVIATEQGRVTWRLHQIVTDSKLCDEGERMSHCVATYRFDCVMGSRSIWSLSCTLPDGSSEPRVTIELMRDGAIAQCRGKHNRAPTAEEAAVIRLWANEFGLTTEAYELEQAA